MRTHLATMGLVPDELEAWNALLVAHHPDILWMFAVWHSKAVGLTLSQTLLSASAVHVVEPNTTCSGEEQSYVWTDTYSAEDEGFLVEDSTSIEDVYSYINWSFVSCNLIIFGLFPVCQIKWAMKLFSYIHPLIWFYWGLSWVMSYTKLYRKSVELFLRYPTNEQAITQTQTKT